MDAKLKEQIRDRMSQVLNAYGYPNLTHEQILDLLPVLWMSVIDLVPLESGFTFQHFKLAAQKQYIKHKGK